MSRILKQGIGKIGAYEYDCYLLDNGSHVISIEDANMLKVGAEIEFIFEAEATETPDFNMLIDKAISFNPKKG